MNRLESLLESTMDEESACRRIERELPAEDAVLKGRYVLTRRIARGGMASIWEAEDRTLERIVAIKFMAEAYVGDADYRRLFEEEAKVAAKLRSPHVVHVYDHGVARGVPFTVMERLVGEDLHERLRREKRLPLKAVGKIASEAGRALREAHAAGIVHGDLKPQNLFMARQGDVETLKLVDFGVARHGGIDPLELTHGVTLGTPFYMSPEQVRREHALDPRADLWSLGAILYRALTGARPFEGDVEQVAASVAHDRPRPPSAVVTDLSTSFDAFFEAALAPERELRFPDAETFIAAFQAAVIRAPTAFGGGFAEDPVVKITEIQCESSRGDADTSPVPVEVLARLSRESQPLQTSGLRLGTLAPARGLSCDPCEPIIEAPPEAPCSSKRPAPLPQSIALEPALEESDATPLALAHESAWYVIVDSDIPRADPDAGRLVVPQEKGRSWIALGLVILLLGGMAALIFLLGAVR